MKAEIRLYRQDGYFYGSHVIKDLSNIEEVNSVCRSASLEVAKAIAKVRTSGNPEELGDYWLSLVTYESQIRLLLASRYERRYYLEDELYLHIIYTRNVDGT